MSTDTAAHSPVPAPAVIRGWGQSWNSISLSDGARPSLPLPIKRAWAGIALLAVALAIAACGNDGAAEPQGELGLEQYFTEVAQAASDSAGSAAYHDHAEMLDALEPPAEVAAEHRAYVAALQALGDALLRGAEQVEATESSEKPQQPPDQGSSVDEANDRAIEACLALQAIADEHGISAYLHCDPHAGSEVSDPNPGPGETLDVTVSLSDGGEPRPGVTCSFAITSQPGDGASLGSATATTDQNGEATVPLDVGDTTGTVEVEADCEGLAQVVSVTVGAGALAPPPLLRETGLQS